MPPTECKVEQGELGAWSEAQAITRRNQKRTWNNSGLRELNQGDSKNHFYCTSMAKQLQLLDLGY